jgi:hypothetical protein
MYPKESYETKLLKSSRTFCQRWTGANAFVHAVTISIKSLVLILTFDDRDVNLSNLHISCGCPLFMHAPFRWKTKQIAVRKCDYPGEADGAYEVYDEGTDYRIVCGIVSISEHVKLYRGAREA